MRDGKDYSTKHSTDPWDKSRAASNSAETGGGQGVVALTPQGEVNLTSS